MRAQVARLALTATLFLGWLGYLSYQVATRPVIATTGQPLVLSRPQLLASELDVIAEVEDTRSGPDTKEKYEATVVEVLYPPEGAPVKKGDRIQVTNIADVRGLSLGDTIARLRDAGLDSIPGGGAEILDDAVRQRISRLKCNVQEWIEVHKTAHRLGMRTTATMMFGTGETFDQRMNHFDIVRDIQEETGGFTAFIPWAFQREHTSLGRFVKEEATAVEYLKMLAISRLYLENITNIQSSWVTPG